MELSIRPIIKLLHRYHGVLFVIFVVGGLIFMVLSLNNTINNSSSSSGSADAGTQTPAGFDKVTIDKLNQLHPAGDAPTPLDLSGRSNPFTE